MKTRLHIGVLALILTLLLSVLPAMGDKSIDTNTFSFGDEANYVNLTTNKVIVGPSHFNNEANLFVYDNATYDQVVFKVTGGKDPSTGRYLSDVGIDVGNNGRFEYRFSGSGVGSWGNQTTIMDADLNSYSRAVIEPTVQGDTYYLKLPSRAVVTSTSVNFTHDDSPIYKTGKLTTSNCQWAWTYFYYSNYGYWYPGSYQTSYWGYYYYPYNYPWSTGYLKWNLDDPALQVPDSADILSYQLVQGMASINAYTNYIGGSGSYYHNPRYYGLYAITGNWITPPFIYSTNYERWSYDSTWTDAEKEAYIKTLLPSFRTTPEDRYYVPEYRGSSSSDYQYGINWDISDLAQEWMDDTTENNGVMLAMDETPYYTGLYHRSGYGTSSSYADYYYYNYRGYFYSPGYSTTSYAPYLNIGYNLDTVGPWIDVGADTTKDWSRPGTLAGTTFATGMQSSINQYLRSHFPDEIDDYGNEWTYVPVTIGAETAGRLSISDIQVLYDYDAIVYYNPMSGNLLNEVRSIVPKSGEGNQLIEINVTSSTEGALNFKDLRILGTLPNYAPKTIPIDDIVTFEGVMDGQLLSVTDHFYDVDQDKGTLYYQIKKNNQKDHVNLYLWQDEDDEVWMGVDTSKDENWFGTVTCLLSATDEFGKYTFSNEFKINVEPVNDLPYVVMDLPDIVTSEGVDPILLEYQAPEGRGIASGKEVFVIKDGGSPYFADVEGQHINLDFEFLGPDMMPVNLDWSNEDGHKIYRGADNKVYLTVLPPEYTDDPDNWLIIFGSDPDFSTGEESYHLRIFASDDPYDLDGQTNVTFGFTVNARNDPPDILPLPDITMNEDEVFTSNYIFMDEYISDRDTDMSDVQVSFFSSSQDVIVSLDAQGHLVVELGTDFNGVVPVTVEAFDGSDYSTSTFSVRVRTINDAPFVTVANLFDGQVISGMFLVKGTANDVEKQLRSVEIAIVPQGEVLYADDWQLTQGLYVWQYLMDIRYTESGPYTIYVRAFDGKDFSQIASYDVTIDALITQVTSDPPTVSISTPLLGDQSGTITVTGTVNDDSGVVTFVEYRLDGGIWRKASLVGNSEWSLIINTRTLKNEEHNLSVRAYDEKLYSDIVFRRFEVFNLDSDGDGIPNDIEESLLMDPFNKLDGTMDFDGDGYSNQEELMVYNTDPFSGISTPDSDTDSGGLIDTWAIIFIIAAILCAAVIIGLFVLNIRLERSIHLWREDLGRRRAERKPKTLLQRVVEIAPSYIAHGPGVPEGPALPGQPYGEHEMLPPMQE